VAVVRHDKLLVGAIGMGGEEAGEMALTCCQQHTPAGRGEDVDDDDDDDGDDSNRCPTTCGDRVDFCWFNTTSCMIKRRARCVHSCSITTLLRNQRNADASILALSFEVLLCTCVHLITMYYGSSLIQHG
jgi:hypothetical protein